MCNASLRSFKDSGKGKSISPENHLSLSFTILLRYIVDLVHEGFDLLSQSEMIIALLDDFHPSIPHQVNINICSWELLVVYQRLLHAYFLLNRARGGKCDRESALNEEYVRGEIQV